MADADLEIAAASNVTKREAIERRRHREMLIICALAIAAAPLLKVLPDERVAVRGVDAVLPPSCPSRTIFKVSCPGCGLTRSFVHLSRADWDDSVRCNRVGWILMIAVAMQIPYRLHALYGSGRFLVGPSFSWWFGMGLIVLLIGNWVYGMIIRAGV